MACKAKTAAFACGSLWCPRVESNHDPQLRRLLFYPLNYRDAEKFGQERRVDLLRDKINL